MRVVVGPEGVPEHDVALLVVAREDLDRVEEERGGLERLPEEPAHQPECAGRERVLLLDDAPGQPLALGAAVDDQFALTVELLDAGSAVHAQASRA